MGFAHSSHGFLLEPLIWRSDTLSPLSQDHDILFRKHAVGESVKRALPLCFLLLCSLPISQVLLSRELALLQYLTEAGGVLEEFSFSTDQAVLSWCCVFFCEEWCGGPVYVALLVHFT